MIAEKKLGVKYIELTCKSCKTSFHAELGAARMAPGAERVVLDSESLFTELSQPFAQRLKDYSKGTPAEMLQRAKSLYEMVDSEPGLKCPKCGEFAGQYLRDVLSKHANATRRSEIDKKHLKIEPPRNSTKPVYSYLLIDPDWLNGSPGIVNGAELGGLRRRNRGGHESLVSGAVEKPPTDRGSRSGQAGGRHIASRSGRTDATSSA